MTTAAQVLQGLFSAAGLEDPYRYYAELRRHGPVSLIGGSGPYPAVVTGYDAVNQVLRDPRVRVTDDAFSDTHGGTAWRAHPLLAALNNSMMYSNGERHGAARGLFQQVFTPRRVQELEPAMVAQISLLIDGLEARLAADGEADFMAEFAYLLPSSVVAALLGIPAEDLAWFRPRVQRINEFLDVTGKTAEVLRRADEATVELSDYYRRLIAVRRAAPADDLISRLVAEGSSEVSDEELVCNLLVLFNASFVTTIHLLGNGLSLLLEHPELRSYPVEPFVEEVLRYESPVQFVARYADDVVEVAGTTIPPKEVVLVMLGAANRDPETFSDADRFEPARFMPDPEIHTAERRAGGVGRRGDAAGDSAVAGGVARGAAGDAGRGRAATPPTPTGARPLSFGAGPHFCLGAALARTEAQLAFPLLMERLPGLRAARAAVRYPQQFLRGYESMPVEVCDAP
ncbi:cytochrome P450 [Kribbella sp. DT2]|uniref:cytochrome P450 n=1 Tax=Kribbella sp. DT2 TaxID=3393427 RepID=UPI003CE79BF1